MVVFFACVFASCILVAIAKVLVVIAYNVVAMVGSIIIQRLCVMAVRVVEKIRLTKWLFLVLFEK